MMIIKSVLLPQGRALAAAFAALVVGSVSLAQTAPASTAPKPYEVMDYGPFLSATISASAPGANIANKGIAIKVGPNGEGAVLFDIDLVRFAAGWTGKYLNLNGVVFDARHGPNPSVAGDLAFVTNASPGWSVDAGRPDRPGELADPRATPFGPLPANHAKYRGLYLHGNQTVVAYTVADTEILELPGLTQADGQNIFTRTLQVGPMKEGRTMVVADVVPFGSAPSIEKSAGGATTLGFPAADASKTLVTLAGAPEGAKIEVINGSRVILRVPALPNGATFRVAIWNGKAADEAKAEAAIAKLGAVADVAALTKGGPARWTAAITTKGTLGAEDGAYAVDTITAPYDNPYKSWLRFGAMDLFADGSRAALTTWSGDVWVVSGIDATLGELKWKRFATGLHQPLGLRIVNDEVFVLGRDQLVRLKDLNNDGEADFYESFNNDVIVSPSFHEFALDLQTDAEGNFYFAKGGAVRPGGRGWQVITPHTGSVIRISKDGKKLDVFATGVRAPNGMSAGGPRGEITLADNEGTWTPTSRINIVKPGDFLGVVDLAHRDEAPTTYGNPITWIPHSIDNSSGGQVWVPDERFGLPKGQLLHTSYGKSSLFVVAYETLADGTVQGGVSRLPLEFEAGMMRPRFNPKDGQLYISGLKGWQTTARRDGAFQRVRRTGKPVEVPVALSVKADGIEVGFTAPLNKASAEDLQNWSLEQWNYLWSQAYGSAEYSVVDPTKQVRDPVTVKSAKLSADGKKVFLEIPGLKPVMQMKIKFLVDSASGEPLDYEIYNTIAKVPAR